MVGGRGRDRPRPISGRGRRFRESWGVPLLGGSVLAAVTCVVMATFGLLGAGDGNGSSVAGDGSVRAGAVIPPASLPATPESSKPAEPAVVGNGPRQPTGNPVRIAFGGDVHFEGSSRQRLTQNPETAVGPMAQNLAGADLAMVNLETAVTTGGTPAAKTYVFRAPPTAFTALRGAGIDVVNMANNHGMDYGQDGLADTLRSAGEARFPTVGIGTDDTSAYAPYLTTVNGQRIAIFGATQVLDDELATAWTAGPGKPGLASAKNVERLAAAIRAVRPTVDTLIVYLHWGTERETCPNQAQRSLVAPLVAAGADALIGGHAHVLQGAGWSSDGAYVAYGLGNFVFYASGTGPNTETGVLELTFRGRAVTAANWVPGRIVDGAPSPLTGTAGTQALDKWNSLRGCAGLTGTAPW
ncbi:poly-gamma-glutamate biosynthesis protein [Frankia sp. CcI49]|uniref:CapA family protein n=1 Tax=Frankia sp. R43 TaxID=269536 RepID=UPI0006CA5C52|nr:poly-gamma-glutamate biosynthesis protein [Frankia sp. R43]ONH57762.1 poly-gamma-glutamate biosynthesis protein [Frankia sp. CcI49]